MEAAAPPTATSSSPCGFLSLSTWTIFEYCSCCHCFFLPHFAMPHPACTAATAKKSLRQSLLLLNFLTSIIGIAIALSVALLGPQKTPSCLDRSSSSTHSNKHQPPWIFSLSTWMILESCNCCLCFFLPHFAMPHSACTAATAKNHCSSICCCCIFWHQNTVRLHLWKRYFCRSRAAKDSDWFLSFLIKATFTSFNNQPLYLIDPSSPDLLKSRQNRLRKTHNPQICTFSWTVTCFDLLSIFVSS